MWKFIGGMLFAWGIVVLVVGPVTDCEKVHGECKVGWVARE